MGGTFRDCDPPSSGRSPCFVNCGRPECVDGGCKHVARRPIPASESVGSARLLVRAADRMALGIRQAVKVGILSSRSEAADALLDYMELNDHRVQLGLDAFPSEEEDRMTQDEYADYIRTGRRGRGKTLPVKEVADAATRQLVAEGVLKEDPLAVGDRVCLKDDRFSDGIVVEVRESEGRVWVSLSGGRWAVPATAALTRIVRGMVLSLDVGLLRRATPPESPVYAERPLSEGEQEELRR